LWHHYSNGSLTIAHNQQVIYLANQVTLNQGFEVEIGAEFEAQVDGFN